MYQGDLSRRDRVGPAIAVILVHLGLGAMLLGLSGHLAPMAVENALKVIDLTPEITPPPPPPPPEKPAATTPARRNAPAPPAPKAEATPIVAPKPIVLVPVPVPIVAAPVPNQGAAPSQGAATAGAGSGAGGTGNGTGGGGSGTGGNGDDGGTHPQPRFRPLDPRGFPRALVEPLPPDTRVMIIFDVELNGRISNCAIRQSSGSPALDALLCRVASDRFRYEPARHADGTPYVAKAAYLLVF